MPDPTSTPPARCPHCHAELPAAALARGPSRKRRWLGGLLGVGVLLLGVLLLAYRYKGQIVTVLDLVNDETGSTSLSVAALALAASVLAGLAGWFLLPFFLAWAYLDLRRRLGPPSEVRPPR